MEPLGRIEVNGGRDIPRSQACWVSLSKHPNTRASSHARHVPIRDRWCRGTGHREVDFEKSQLVSRRVR